MASARFLTSGDTAVVVEFGDRIDREPNALVLKLSELVRAERIRGIVETLPTFRSLLVHYDPLMTDRAHVVAALEALLERARGGVERFRVWRIPACYEGDYAPDLPEVDVDGRLLSRTVAEIVKNAAQHSDPGAAIAVRAHASGPDVVVTVTDGGGGIGPEDLPRLFEPFFRSRATRRHLPGRTGLGLTLAKRVVEAHGGSVSEET